MKLDEFVKQTLLDITNAVYEAKNESFISIAPGRFMGEIIPEPQMVNFEVAVTTSKEGKAGISVWSAANTQGSLSSEHVNKISFSVPIYFQGINDLKEN